MIRIVNVSKKIVTIGNMKIRPLQNVIFDFDNADEYTKNRINSLSNIGIIKIYMGPMEIQETIDEIENVDDETKSTKKTTRKYK